MRSLRAPSWHGPALISSWKAWHTTKQRPHGGSTRDRGHVIQIRHEDRSTLCGQCSFPILEAQTRQPVAVLDQDDANLRITDLPNEASTMPVHPGADLLDGLDDPQRFA
ncbi:hypothetical protein [Candidatus Methylacidithermus pantelleriae]|uniref:hypothetical protein n=1 Tax=Candidatus Methylacidithermus pantelleriae TaxID=2744239 RepID=UPI00157C76F7|nr:hypothetical protein [Candidatus Methylacidithermus pantelleriae]